MTQVTLHVIRADGSVQSALVDTGLSVMEGCLQMDISGIEGLCMGAVNCATCHVYVHPDWIAKVTPPDGDLGEAETDLLDITLNRQPSSRLSCQIILTPELDGLMVAVPRPDFMWDPTG